VTAITASICIRGWRRVMLPEAIRSALDQGRDDVEVIVGDELGGLADIAASFEDPRVRYIHVGPLGPNAHAAALLAEARGRYVALLDDDDRWLPGFLDATIACLEADPALGVAFTNFFYGVGGYLCERSWRLAEGRHEHLLLEIMRGCPLLLSAALIRRTAYEQGQQRHPARNDMLLDAALWLGIAVTGWSFYFVDTRLAVQRLHPAQRTRQDGRVRDQSIAFWSSYALDDPECESLRRYRLAEALLVRAGFHIRHGRFAAALADIRHARVAAPGPMVKRGLVALLGLRPAVFRAFARHPRVVRPALRAWRVLEPLDRFQLGSRA
jgi:glycosyltransferase involved in cell wall biosynthesis